MKLIFCSAFLLLLAGCSDPENGSGVGMFSFRQGGDVVNGPQPQTLTSKPLLKNTAI